MAFLTNLTAPKSFTEPHANIIQRNADQTWKDLPGLDVMFVGDEPGILGLAQEFGVRSVQQKNRHKKGIPTACSVMKIGHTIVISPFQRYANTDMILMDGTLSCNDVPSLPMGN